MESFGLLGVFSRKKTSMKWVSGKLNAKLPVITGLIREDLDGALIPSICLLNLLHFSTILRRKWKRALNSGSACGQWPIRELWKGVTRLQSDKQWGNLSKLTPLLRSASMLISDKWDAAAKSGSTAFTDTESQEILPTWACFRRNSATWLAQYLSSKS